MATDRRWLIPAALGAILLTAAILRFADLGANPGGLFTDEAWEAFDAQRLLHQPGFHPVFLADGGGREALFAYLVAGVFRVAGETTLALRATAAGIGVLGIFGIWILGRRFGMWTGLAAAAWAAGSLWLICVSRDGMRNTLVPLLGALALAAIILWQDRPSRATALLAGSVTSLAALYTYQPLKLLPVLVIIWLVWLLRVNRPAVDGMRAHAFAFAAAFVVIGLPMIAAAAANPSMYFARAAGVTLFTPQAQGDANFGVHLLRTLGMFAVTGDPNPRHDVDALPLLGLPLLLVGVAGLYRLWRHRSDAAHALILWSLPLFLLPPLVATEGGSPHFLRSLGLAAPLAVTVGLGLVELVEQARNRWGARAGQAAVLGAVIGLVVLAVGSGTAYLSRPLSDRYAAFSFDLVALADAGRAAGSAIIVDDYQASVIRFLDASDLPAILPPGSTIREPAEYARILALTRADLSSALGSFGEPAESIARDPAGRPVVWAITP